MKNIVKFKRKLYSVGGGTGTSSTVVTFPPELLDVIKVKSGDEIRMWYDPEREVICISSKDD